MVEKPNAVAWAQDKNWWRGTVIYQIYPRSFQDSNGDGIGDLAGIVQRLPHIAELGADAIWISPFFTSPMKDFGYDVSDYCDVDPMFGQLADFDAVIARAHDLGLRVMIDLVLSHTSDAHPWFRESRASRTNTRANWYVWADPKMDGTAPNNWLSIFGGSAWQWDARREQYFLHNFLTSQPDLNFHEPQVQDALLDVARFWLDRGVDGFRLDTINFYTHDKYLRDNPALPPEQRNADTAPAVNPYNHQMHLFDKSQPENIEFLKKLRAVMKPYNAAAVGEVGDAQRGLEILGEYTRGDDRMQMCYAFEFLSPKRLTPARVVETFDALEAAAPDGWACWAFSNHDVVRHITRWGLSVKAAKAYATLLMCLRGSACLYQGEELGLPEADIAFEDLQDPYGIEFWPEFKGRDGCRTPMVWQSDNQTGGFSAGKPWLPVPAQHLQLAGETARGADSLFAHYQTALGLRRQFPVLRSGVQRGLTAQGDLLTFIRETDTGEDALFCAFNLGDQSIELPAPKGLWQSVWPNGGAALGKTITLGPWQVCLASKA
ncbi:alpha-amylase family glycosyl hydrolase [Pseudorhodobacter ferrugineus]|uniref:alpha-amylase family glycosyl hydrolase n=1 Tax=Pseudorhodobacter ferrugineus TaxID=77008 RepID=UPI0003B40064|nr:alpha-amylase family glycosyl hydrolase [Pseudorhodobacter ferrugineus]